MADVKGGSLADGNVTGYDLSTLTIDSGRAIYAYDGSNNLTHYLVEDVQKSGGQLLAGGNYANPAPSASGGTNLSYTRFTNQGVVVSDTGTDALIPAGSTIDASLMLPGDKSKIDGIESGAQVNKFDFSDATSDGNVYGRQNGNWVSIPGGGDMLKATYDPTNVAGDAFSMGNMKETTTAKVFTDSERAKLSGIGAGAQLVSVVGGTDITIDNTDPQNPVINYTGSGGGATNLSYTASPTNGVVESSTGTNATIPLADNTNAGLLSPAEKSSIDSAVQSVQAGTNITVDNTDPKNPVISSSGGGGATTVLGVSIAFSGLSASTISRFILPTSVTSLLTDNSIVAVTPVSGFDSFRITASVAKETDWYIQFHCGAAGPVATGTAVFNFAIF